MLRQLMSNKYPFVLLYLCGISAILFFTGCSADSVSNSNTESETILQTSVTTPDASINTIPTDTSIFEDNTSPVTEATEPPYKFIFSEGTTLETRIHPPKGYTRTETNDGSFLAFTRNLSLKPDGSPIMLFDGTERSVQSAHVAVFDFDIGERDLQQCADSIMRVYSEYYWSVGEYDKIAFHLSDDFLMEYTKWRDGYRIHVTDDSISWTHSAGYDDSYECFRKYLDMVYAYSGTLHLEDDCTPVEKEDLQAGDMFIKGGSPGHCVLVVDTAEDKQGNVCFLLAQGYMPAQDFHVLTNPLHEDDPWYYVSEITYPFRTAQYTFQEECLKRWKNF